MIEILKDILIPAWYYCSSSHYRKLHNTISFDADFYLRTNPDVRENQGDPLLHYMRRGHEELRQPNALFDTRYYVTQVPELQNSQKDPIQYFLDDGWRSSHKISPYFDPTFYETHADASAIPLNSNPLLYYLEHDRHSAASIYFDATYYSRKYRDVSEEKEHPLLHFLRLGIQEKRQPSPFFDVAYYYDNTPGLEESGIEPLSHYFRFGIKEGKSPCPLFDPEYYAKIHPGQKGDDPFQHFIEYGANAGCRPCSWFDPIFYCDTYLGPETRVSVAIEHYLSTGVHEGVYPNKKVAGLPQKPLISLIVPVYNVSSRHLNNCIRSVLYQSYPHWELCLVDDHSTGKVVRLMLQKWAALDTRIKVGFLEKNQGISGASNAAANLATGDYLGFLDDDDELAEECLFTVVQRINDEGADLYYSDEDLIGEDGRCFSVFRKPDFNKELLLGHNYVTHFVVTTKKLYDGVGGFDGNLDGAQDYDLFLKLSEQAHKIVHIPKILYHWRASQSSTSINHEQKDYADGAGRKAVANAMQRRNVAADVLLTEWKFFYRTRRKMLSFQPVSILISYEKTGDFDSWLATLISATSYPDIEFIVVVDNDKQRASLQPKYGESGLKVNFVVVSNGCPRAGRYNSAARKASGKYLIFLSAQIQLQEDDWVESLLQYTIDKKSGMVGGQIKPFSSDDLVTTLPVLDSRSELYYARFLQRCSQHMNGLQTVQDVVALSWDMAMVDRMLFLECNGFDEKSLGHLFADSDFCLRLRQKGYENIYTPYALGQWLAAEDTQSLAAPSEILHIEKRCFQKRWQDVLSAGDPYYNLGLFDQNDVDRISFLEWYIGLSSG